MVTKRSGLAFFSSGFTAWNLDFKKDISVYIIISKESQNCKNTWSSRPSYNRSCYVTLHT